MCIILITLYYTYILGFIMPISKMEIKYYSENCEIGKRLYYETEVHFM